MPVPFVTSKKRSTMLPAGIPLEEIPHFGRAVTQTENLPKSAISALVKNETNLRGYKNKDYMTFKRGLKDCVQISHNLQYQHLIRGYGYSDYRPGKILITQMEGRDFINRKDIIKQKVVIV